MADTALRFTDESFAKRCCGNAVLDFDSSAAGFHFAGGCGLERDTKIVQSPGAGQAGVNCHVENVVAIAEQTFYMLES